MIDAPDWKIDHLAYLLCSYVGSTGQSSRSALRKCSQVPCVPYCSEGTHNSRRNMIGRAEFPPSLGTEAMLPRVSLQASVVSGYQ